MEYLYWSTICFYTTVIFTYLLKLQIQRTKYKHTQFRQLVKQMLNCFMPYFGVWDVVLAIYIIFGYIQCGLSSRQLKYKKKTSYMIVHLSGPPWWKTDAKTSLMHERQRIGSTFMLISGLCSHQGALKSGKSFRNFSFPVPICIFFTKLLSYWVLHFLLKFNY